MAIDMVESAGRLGIPGVTIVAGGFREVRTGGEALNERLQKIASQYEMVTVAGAIDREADGASRTITVRATSADGSFTDQVFSIAINDVDEFDTGPIADSNAAANTVAENAAIGTTVGLTGLASDADATATVSYSLDDNAGGRFAIHATTGVVTVNAALDYETASSHSVTIRATSSDGSYATQSFTLAVTDVNEAGVSALSDADGAADFVLENSANGTTVGLDGVGQRSGRHRCRQLHAGRQRGRPV